MPHLDDVKVQLIATLARLLVSGRETVSENEMRDSLRQLNAEERFHSITSHLVSLGLLRPVDGLSWRIEKKTEELNGFLPSAVGSRPTPGSDELLCKLHDGTTQIEAPLHPSSRIWESLPALFNHDNLFNCDRLYFLGGRWFRYIGQDEYMTRKHRGGHPVSDFAREVTAQEACDWFMGMQLQMQKEDRWRIEIPKELTDVGRRDSAVKGTSNSNSRKFTFQHDGGPVANDVCGTYVTVEYEGEEQLLCFQRFKESKRMEKLGDSIHVEPPSVFLLPGVSIRLAQKMPSQVDGKDIAGEGWVYTQSGIAALQAMDNVTDEFRQNPISTALKLHRRCPDKAPHKAVPDQGLDARMLDQIHEDQPVLERDLDTQAKDQILIGDMMAICGKANQIFRLVLMFDYGIDGEVEFKDSDGQPSGKKIYIQLKSGNSYLRIRKGDGSEVFDVKHERHLNYWMSQPVDVYLVIRQQKEAAGEEIIRWMNVTRYLKDRMDKQSRQIIFQGATLDTDAVRKVRDEHLAG